MKDTDLLWIIGIGAALYFAYQKGFGALVGLCPPGYTLGAGDVFPACRNNLSLAGDALLAGPEGQAHPRPTTHLAYPMDWGWDGSKWVAVRYIL